MNELELDFSVFENGNQASEAVLTYLQQRFGFDLWMTTRTTEPHWIVLQSSNNQYGVDPGQVFKWADSFCSQMVMGNGPYVALNSNEVPAYAMAEIGRQVDIGAYIGVPINMQDGSLFGTLCAIDPYPQTLDINNELPMIQLFSRLLGTIMSRDLLLMQQERQIERLQQALDTDTLTGLLNRRGWEMAVAREQSRHERYGSPICIFILDLDELKRVNDTYGHEKGDQLLKTTADCLRASVRNTDVIARVGGDEFAVMAIECDCQASDSIYEVILKRMSFHNIKVSLGKSMHDPRVQLNETMRVADQAMYEMKKRNRTID